MEERINLCFSVSTPSPISSPISLLHLLPCIFSLSVGSFTWAFEHEQIALSFKKSPSNHPLSLLTPFPVILLAELSTPPNLFSPTCFQLLLLWAPPCSLHETSRQWPPSDQPSLTSLDYAATSDTTHHSAFLIIPSKIGPQYFLFSIICR